jgi:hypothetical protein
MSWRLNSEFEISLHVAAGGIAESKPLFLKPQALRNKVSSGGTATEIVLPFANLLRGALHLGLEDLVGYAA